MNTILLLLLIATTAAGRLHWISFIETKTLLRFQAGVTGLKKKSDPVTKSVTGSKKKSKPVTPGQKRSVSGGAI